MEPNSVQPHVSHFARIVNLPICEYVDSTKSWKSNPNKPVVAFMSGDPTVYGNQDFKMPQLGYELLRQSILDAGHHGYSNSSGCTTTKTAVLKLYKPIISVTQADVFINHGVNYGLLSLLLALTNQGDQVLVPELGYPFFHSLCPAYKRHAIPYKFKANFEIDLEKLSTQVTDKTTFIYVINPSNPAGSVFSVKHMQQILEFSDSHQLPIVADQVYFRQAYPSSCPHVSFGELTEDVPVIVLCGVEKVLSVPGWTTGWTIFFDKHRYLDTIKHNLSVIGTIFLHNNVFTQLALPNILEKVGLFTSPAMKTVETTARYLSTRINTIAGLKAVPSEGTIYMSVAIDLRHFSKIADDRDFVSKLYSEQSVKVMPLSAIGSGLAGFRLLICAPEQFYTDFLNRLEEFVQVHIVKHHKSNQ